MDSPPVPVEDRLAETTAKLRRSRVRQDVRSIIKLILESPVSGSAEDLVRVDGYRSLSSYSGKPVDVQTQMLLKVTAEALKGDMEKIKFLMDYGGYRPPKESQISFKPPTIINNVPLTDPPIMDVTPKPKGVPAPVENAMVVDVEVTDVDRGL